MNPNNAEHNNESQYFLSAAIDFGTTYSGLAYSYAHDQDKVYVISEWPDGTVANKIPTTILFDANLNFEAFGQEAIDAYDKHAEDEEEKEYYLFHRFKMDLHKEKGITKILQLKDINGKTMNAMTVFSTAIKFLKDHLIYTINKRYPANELRESHVNWVITVPAIWNDSAKQFMRQAGEKSGISRRNLQIALEPEAASLCCLKTPRDNMILGGDFTWGDTKYLVIDNGGGTVDITAHQIIGNNKLKELYKASGGAMGGTQVDERFADYLSTLFSPQNILEIQNKHPSQWIKILQDFELAKKKVYPKNKDKFFSFALTADVFNIQYFNTLSSQERKNSEVKNSGRLRIPKDVIEEMISDTTEKITNHVRSLLQKPELNDIEYIIMVGGFSNSSILVDRIKNLAEVNNLTVLVPEEAQMSVVKGAVLLGWKPEMIHIRKCRRTYGFAVKNCFIKGVHPDRHMCINKSEIWCDNIFETLVQVNQDIEIDHVITQTYLHNEKSNEGTTIFLYATNAPGAQYCDDDGVFKVGKLELETPYNEKNRSIEVQVFFGNTEIHVKAKHLASGNTSEEKFDFL